VRAKKTQRSKDWPVIELLVTIHNREHGALPTDAHIDFWLFPDGLIFGYLYIYLRSSDLTNVIINVLDLKML
jgi:hypothetical protein